MFAILGATGNVGASTCRALREVGAPVRAIARDTGKVAPLRELGCEVVLADLQDSVALASAMAGADAVQIIIPVVPRAADPAADLRRSCTSVMRALQQARPSRVLLISDYGAHVADDIGMPSVFREVEGQLRQLEGHKIILRSAEHMHNWGRSIPMALANGVLPSFQDPVEMAQPTIAARDLGLIAADLLLRDDLGERVTVVHAEGPVRYSASDVATALSQLSGKPIQAKAVPRDQWEGIFEKVMPHTLADLLIRANDAKNRGRLVDVGPDSNEVIRGRTPLAEALKPLLPPR